MQVISSSDFYCNRCPMMLPVICYEIVVMSLIASIGFAEVYQQAIEGAFLVREPFYWGAATAAYQIEGATDEDGRGPSIWDSFSSIPGKIAHNDTGNVADDSYHMILEDVSLLKSLGVNSYRFSFSWTRILPQGTGEINQAGVDHYNRVIDALEDADIEPFVTLYHWDLPQALEDRYDGLLGVEFVNDFTAFADVCFRLFGDRVRHWITINEPWTVSYLAYGAGTFAPGRCSDRARCSAGNSATESYIAGHNLLNAHAAVVALYRSKYKRIQHGLIGITLNLDWVEPYRADDPEDVLAAERRREFVLGWFADPVFFGHYPSSMVSLVGDRMPTFTQEQSRLLKGSLDFLGLNHYSTKYIIHRFPGGLAQNPHLDVHMFDKDNNGNSASLAEVLDALDANPAWVSDQLTLETKYNPQGELIGPQGASAWLNMVPQGFYELIMWTHRRYNLADLDKPWIYITENGCDAPGEETTPLPAVLEDTFRIDYLRGYLGALDQAIKDGVRIKGYFAWSLLDNFEWADGFGKRFGLFYVDYSSTDPQNLRPRHAKASAVWYHDYIAQHGSYTGTQRVEVPIYVPGRGSPGNTGAFGDGILGAVLSLSSCTSAQTQCTWWQSLLGSYLSQSMLQAGWKLKLNGKK